MMFGTNSTGPGLALWNGTTWTWSQMPDGVSAASCASAVQCVAVTPAANAETWNGLQWSESTTAPDSNGPVKLTGISCPQNGFCVATGSDDYGGIIETLQGGIWSMLDTFVDYTSIISDVSCVSTVACTAIGVQGDNYADQAEPEAFDWNGTSWTEDNSPYYPDSDIAPLVPVAISCVAAYTCIAATSYETSGYQTPIALIEQP
jgi:hypothetical protein